MRRSYLTKAIVFTVLFPVAGALTSFDSTSPLPGGHTYTQDDTIALDLRFEHPLRRPGDTHALAMIDLSLTHPDTTAHGLELTVLRPGVEAQSMHVGELGQGERKRILVPVALPDSGEVHALVVKASHRSSRGGLVCEAFVGLATSIAQAEALRDRAVTEEAERLSSMLAMRGLAQ